MINDIKVNNNYYTKRETTIEDTLNSIEKIKSENIEYIIIDGLSTDKIFNIIRSKRIIDKLISEKISIYNAMNKE